VNGVERFDRDLRPQQLHQSGRIGERGGGVVRQGDEGPAEAHAACTRVGEAELEGDDRLLVLGRDAGRCQQRYKK
jgi:hypothetical protein